ncbi:hypothetical protein OD632_005376 [Salmonella enterica]|nr:hypothetical protein [Salmonella enterica]
MKHVNVIVENKAVQLNGVIETHEKTVKKNVDEMTFISAKNITDQIKQKGLSPLKNQIAVTKISPEELKEAINEVMIDIKHFSPRVIYIMVTLFDAFNKSNKATADVNAKMVKVNESLTLNTADDIKNKASWSLAANVISTTISTVSGLTSATLSVKAQNLKNANTNLENENRSLESSGDTTTINLNNAEINNNLSKIEELSSKAKFSKYMAELKGYSSFLNIGEAAAESTQVIDQNYAQVANGLYQTGSAESDSNKKHFEALFQAMVTIIDNIQRAGDTAAQNC